MNLSSRGKSHVGMKRSHNEDCLRIFRDEHLYVVADGMGGHAAGEVASEMSAETIASFFRTTSLDDDVTWPFKDNRDQTPRENRMRVGVEMSNLRIFQSSVYDMKLKGMGTTMVAVNFYDNQCSIGHVGDSRVYLIRNQSLEQVTEDHSLLNDYMKLRPEGMTPEEIEAFPHKNVILRALGMKDEVEVDVLTREVKEGDLWLLCSDGLSGMVTDQMMLEIVNRATRDAGGTLTDNDLDLICDRLIEEANLNGGTDNITVVLVLVEPEAGASVPQASSSSPSITQDPKPSGLLSKQNPFEPAWQQSSATSVTASVADSTASEEVGSVTSTVAAEPEPVAAEPATTPESAPVEAEAEGSSITQGDGSAEPDISIKSELSEGAGEMSSPALTAELEVEAVETSIDQEEEDSVQDSMSDLGTFNFSDSIDETGEMASFTSELLLQSHTQDFSSESLATALIEHDQAAQTLLQADQEETTSPEQEEATSPEQEEATSPEQEVNASSSVTGEEVDKVQNEEVKVQEEEVAKETEELASLASSSNPFSVLQSSQLDSGPLTVRVTPSTSQLKTVTAVGPNPITVKLTPDPAQPNSTELGLPKLEEPPEASKPVSELDQLMDLQMDELKTVQMLPPSSVSNDQEADELSSDQGLSTVRMMPPRGFNNHQSESEEEAETTSAFETIVDDDELSAESSGSDEQPNSEVAPDEDDPQEDV